MTSDAQPWIDALTVSHDRLSALVADLDADTVRESSYAKKWTIADVLSHLGSGAEHNALMLAAAVTHSPAPGLEEMQPIWDRWNAKTPDEQLADVVPADAASLAQAVSYSPQERAAARVEFVGMDFDFAATVGMRLAEHAVHTWDIAVMREPGAVVRADAVQLIIDNTILRTAGWAAKPQGLTFTLAIHTTHPARDFTLTVGEAATLSEGAPAEADGSLTLTAEQFVRLVYGRLNDDAGDVPDADGVSIDDVRAVFPGF
ncbi:MAG: hypothetical protein QOG52_602 [Frankiaceae bacterium]|nr:hypothetical protein [Frankiaceae bacterium]